MKKQREIKFRIWDNDKKGFHFLDGIWNMPDPCYDGEIQQFTGLKDVNGKDIFEGDILQDERRVEIIVSWGKHKYDGVVDGWGWNIGTPEKWYEIIGNIHETAKELQDDRGDDSGKYESDYCKDCV